MKHTIKFFLLTLLVSTVAQARELEPKEAVDLPELFSATSVKDGYHNRSNRSDGSWITGENVDRCELRAHGELALVVYSSHVYPCGFYQPTHDNVLRSKNAAQEFVTSSPVQNMVEKCLQSNESVCSLPHVGNGAVLIAWLYKSAAVAQEEYNRIEQERYVARYLRYDAVSNNNKEKTINNKEKAMQWRIEIRRGQGFKSLLPSDTDKKFEDKIDAELEKLKQKYAQSMRGFWGSKNPAPCTKELTGAGFKVSITVESYKESV